MHAEVRSADTSMPKSFSQKLFADNDRQLVVRANNSVNKGISG
jgi:hypothetical protein